MPALFGAFYRDWDNRQPASLLLTETQVIKLNANGIVMSLTPTNKRISAPE
jgi:hypothetical protein